MTKYLLWKDCLDNSDGTPWSKLCQHLACQASRVEVAVPWQCFHTQSMSVEEALKDEICCLDGIDIK